MFGHQDNTQSNDNPGAQDEQSVAFNPALPSSGAPVVGASAPAMPAGPLDQTAPAPQLESDVLPTPSAGVGTNDLLDIKQKALGQLSPLVGHLEQTPEEKFRTTMMMIQASDNQDLVKEAYAAAQEITDEKAKAQALLDIINEINYFTQQHQS